MSDLRDRIAGMFYPFTMDTKWAYDLSDKILAEIPEITAEWLQEILMPMGYYISCSGCEYDAKHKVRYNHSYEDILKDVSDAINKRIKGEK